MSGAWPDGELAAINRGSRAGAITEGEWLERSRLLLVAAGAASVAALYPGEQVVRDRAAEARKAGGVMSEQEVERLRAELDDAIHCACRGYAPRYCGGCGGRIDDTYDGPARCSCPEWAAEATEAGR